jgi:ketohexokinase
VPRFPAEDSKLRATAVQVRRGGNCANSLEVLAQLLAAGPHRLPPVKLHLVSCLPDAKAPATSRILSSFGHGAGAAAIDFGYCLYREGHQEPASSYIIRSAETGSRTIVNYNDLPEMTASEFERIVDAFAEHRDGDGGDDGDGVGCWWHFEVRDIVTHDVT